jgi:AcrR family transcriptional regulator
MDIEVLFPYIDRLRLQMPLENITMDVLASKSGFSRASIYRNFGSRQEIITTYLQKNGEIPPSESLPGIPDRILAAAESVFLTYGFASSTIEMIADEAGLGTATIYRYYENKDNLVAQVLRHISPSDNMVFDQINPDLPFEQAIIEYTRAALTFIRSHHKIFKLIIFESDYLSPINNQMNRVRERTRYKLVDFFFRYLPENPHRKHNAETLTLSFMGLIFGFAFSPMMLEDYEYNEENAVEWVSNLMIHKLGELSV